MDYLEDLYKSTEYDVFALSVKFKKQLKGTVNELEYPKSKRHDNNIFKHIKRDKLEDIEISVFKNCEDLLKLLMGKFY